MEAGKLNNRIASITEHYDTEKNRRRFIDHPESSALNKDETEGHAINHMQLLLLYS